MESESKNNMQNKIKEFQQPYLYRLKTTNDEDEEYRYRILSNLLFSPYDEKDPEYLYFFGIIPCELITSAYIPLNYKNHSYHESKKINLSLPDLMDLDHLLNRGDIYSQYAWNIIKKTILYASSLVPDVTENFNDIDDAMRCGFNWQKGPFEILHEIGINKFLKKLNSSDKIPVFLQSLQKNN